MIGRHGLSPHFTHNILLHFLLLGLLATAILYLSLQVRTISAAQRRNHARLLERTQACDEIRLTLSQLVHEHLYLPALTDPRAQHPARQRITKIHAILDARLAAWREQECPPAIRTDAAAAEVTLRHIRELGHGLAAAYDTGQSPAEADLRDLRSAASLAHSQLALLRDLDLHTTHEAGMHDYHILIAYIFGGLLGTVVFMAYLAVSILRRAEADEQVRRLNAELERRVAERTAELSAANAELDSFARSVSHDLRAPLRGIEGWSQALEEDCGDRLGPDGRAHVTAIRRQVRNMGQLIDALLSLARITRSEMNRVRVNLSAMAHACIRGLREAAPERTVEVRIEPGMVAHADATLLPVAIGNLLENAWKFTAHTPNARIEMFSSAVAGGTVFHVRDNGAGFDMRYAAKLFHPFHRLHRSTEFPGTGIGLTTVARIVNRHGGTISAEAAEGHGATFSFSLAPTAGPGPDRA